MHSPLIAESILQEETLFHAARSLTDSAARNAFLEVVCLDRPDLRARLEDLLSAAAQNEVMFGTLPSNPGPTLDLTVGERLGDYELLREIGRGGMGRVYCARRLSTQQMVALKVLGAGSAAGSEQVRRFETEAAAVTRLQHSNIVPIYEVGSCGGVHFFKIGRAHV